MVSKESGISLLWYFSKSPKNLFSQNASSLVFPHTHTGIFRQQNFEASEWILKKPLGAVDYGINTIGKESSDFIVSELITASGSWVNSY